MAEKIYLAVREDVETLGNHIAPIIDIQIDNIYREIESKNGEIPEEKLLSNIKSSIETIETKEKEYIEGNVTEINTNAYSLRNCAFAYYPSITSFNAPNLDILGADVFYGSRIDNDLTDETFNMPNLATLPQRTFTEATITGSVVNLRYEKLPSELFRLTKCTNANGCDAVFPNATSTDRWTFFGSQFKTITLPNCNVIGSELIRDCQKIISITIGKTPITIGERPFNTPYSLQSVNFPNSNVDDIFALTGMRTGLITTVKFICSDGTIEYINGAWTIVRD